MSDLPRRCQMLKWCEAEHKIAEAMQAVEMMGADIRLTDAVCLLGAARERVADFVDGLEGKRTMPRDVSTGAALPAPQPPDLLTTFTRRLEALARERNWTDDHDARLVCEAAVGVLRAILGAALPAEHAPPDPNGPIRWCKHEECKAERGTGALPGSDYCVDHDPKLRAWKAIEWAVSLLEIHEGVKANSNSQWWLNELRAAQKLVDGGSRPALAGRGEPTTCPKCGDRLHLIERCTRCALQYEHRCIAPALSGDQGAKP